jgi:sialate O-acetylesterase
MKIYCFLSLSITSVLLTFNIQGQDLKLASIFGDNMVIQQGINAPIWGTAEADCIIHIDFAGYLSSSKTGADGKWIIRMPVLEAGGPFEMKITGTDTIILQDVMVGEVWFASGQSNMEWTIGSGVGPRTDAEVSQANYPGIRFYNVPRETSSIPLRDTEKQNWTICSTETVRSLSAVSYFFDRELYRHKNVAVGIISSSWGATSAEAWISSEMLATHPDFRDRIINADNDTSKWNSYVRNSIKAEQEREVIARTSKKGIETGVINPAYDDSGWKKCMTPVDMPGMGLNGYWGLVWLRKQIDISQKTNAKKLKLEVNILAKDAIFYINGTEVTHLINPAKTVAIDIKPGILKQGHNEISVRLYVNWGSAHIGTKNQEPYIVSDDNKFRVSLEGEWKFSSEIEPPVAQWQDYYNKLSVLYNARIAPVIPYGIKGVIWYQGENNAGNGYQYRTLFPLLIEDWRVRWQLGYFPFLYVQLANYMEKQQEPVESDWAELREAQLMTLKYPNTGMAVTIDIGDPADIHPRNKLDIGKRLFLLARKIAYGENITDSGPLYKSAEIEGNNIIISFTSTGIGLAASEGNLLKGFAIAGSDKHFYWADATINGDKVVVCSAKVQEPQAVRYSWANNPEGNLINREGLPASPFRTDNWNTGNQ